MYLDKKCLINDDDDDDYFIGPELLLEEICLALWYLLEYFGFERVLFNVTNGSTQKCRFSSASDIIKLRLRQSEKNIRLCRSELHTNDV